MRNVKVLILTGMLLTLGVSFAFAMAGTGFIQDTLVGKPAADFTLTTTQGNTVNLNEHRGGKKAIIFVWATWCPHCRTELKRLNEMQEEFAAKGIKPIIISLGEDKATVQAYLASHQYGLDVLLDEDQTLADPYRLIGVPTLFFINEQGIIKRVDHALADDYEESFK